MSQLVNYSAEYGFLYMWDSSEMVFAAIPIIRNLKCEKVFFFTRILILDIKASCVTYSVCGLIVHFDIMDRPSTVFGVKHGPQ